jgi:hypothetical protein
VTRGRSRAHTSPRESWRSLRRAGIECAQNAFLESGGVPRGGESTCGQVGIDAGRAARARPARPETRDARRRIECDVLSELGAPRGRSRVSASRADARDAHRINTQRDRCVCPSSWSCSRCSSLAQTHRTPHGRSRGNCVLLQGGRMRSCAAVRTDPRRAEDFRRIPPCPARKAYEPALGRRRFCVCARLRRSPS